MRKLNFKKVNVYAVAWVVLVLAVVFSLFTREPFGFYDEHIHYLRSLGISNGQLLAYSKNNDNSKYGHDIDSENLRYIDKYIYKGHENVISTKWVYAEEGSSKKSNQTEYSIITSAAPYSPVVYMPYAAGSVVATAFDANMRTEFLTMRLFGAITALGIVYAAFRTIPRKFKWTVMAISLLPMSLAAFAGISTDGITVAAALLFISVLFRFIELIKNKESSMRQVILLVVSSLLLVFVKMPTFLLLASLFVVLIIYRKNIPKNQKIVLWMTLLVSAIVTLGWAYYVKDINTGAYWGRDVSTGGQIKFILENPLAFLRLLVHSVLDYDYTNVVYLSNAEHQPFRSMPFVVDIIVWCGIFLSAFVSSEKAVPKKQEKTFYLMNILIFVIIVFAIFTLLYLQFTTIGTIDKIDGVQPRYFVPFLILLAASPYTMKLTKNWRNFAYTAPFIGAFFYLGYLIAQLI